MGDTARVRDPDLSVVSDHRMTEPSAGLAGGMRAVGKREKEREGKVKGPVASRSF